MKLKSSTLFGILLILFGGLILGSNLLAATTGFRIQWFKIWRFWPVLVVMLGLMFTASPLLWRDKRGLGALYIPGLPILVTGGILFLASTLNNWEIWSFLWPLEVLALALGFTFAALTIRSVGLGVPAIIIGLNGLVLQFCAITGFWSAWSFLWAIEPLAIGLVLLMFSLRYHNKPTFIIGASFCGFALVAFLIMLMLTFTGWWAFRYIGPALLVAGGILMLLLGLVKKPSDQDILTGEGSAS
ncbi:MAG: hypothetical protein ISR58_04985 [Anaerolineales bacterium]|nr:hypothetical protein [Chloroflexota bacterium]MBL6980527.1 hypothetical protein [Anaerolineales bacterium]